MTCRSIGESFAWTYQEGRPRGRPSSPNSSRRHTRFFEALVAGNPDTSRPHNVEIIFGRRIRRYTAEPSAPAIDRQDIGGVIVSMTRLQVSGSFAGIYR